MAKSKLRFQSNRKFVDGFKKSSTSNLTELELFVRNNVEKQQMIRCFSLTETDPHGHNALNTKGASNKY